MLTALHISLCIYLTPFNCCKCYINHQVKKAKVSANVRYSSQFYIRKTHQEHTVIIVDNMGKVNKLEVSLLCTAMGSIWFSVLHFKYLIDGSTNLLFYLRTCICIVHNNIFQQVICYKVTFVPFFKPAQKIDI